MSRILRLLVIFCAVVVLPATAKLANSPWPIVHGSLESKDSTKVRVPAGDKTVGVQKARELDIKSKLRFGDASPVSVVSTPIPNEDGSYYLWTSSIRNIALFRLSRDQKLTTVDRMDHGLDLRFHGAYAFVSEEGCFYATSKNKVSMYCAVDEKIKLTAQIEAATSDVADGDDHLVGITLLPDDTIVVATKWGMVTAMSYDLSTVKAVMNLEDALYTSANGLKGLHTGISNSFSSSGMDVYVVTQYELAKLTYSAESFTISWSTPYGAVAHQTVPWYPMRLGPGSGSTPSITECEGQKMVVITDGEVPMTVQWYNAEDGSLLAKKVVQFGSDESGSVATTSEQSVAVAACDAFVVQNYIGKDFTEATSGCGSMGTFLSKSVCRNAKNPYLQHVCPTILGCHAAGAAVYSYSNGDVIRTWSRDDVSCGTSIPLITEPMTQGENGGRVFCVGRDMPNQKSEAKWSLFGFDLETGETKLKQHLEDGRFVSGMIGQFNTNPFYAGIEALGDGVIGFGTLAGVVIISEETAGPPSSIPTLI